MKKFFLDARELAHPEPLRISLEYLKEMSKKDYFYMLNVRKPIPLLELAKDKGYKLFTHEDSSENWHIIISKDQQKNLEELLDV